MSLSLKDPIGIEKDKGLQAQINTNIFEAEKFQFRSQSVNRLPQFSINANLPGLNRSFNSITQPDGTIQFRSQSPAYSTATLHVNQQITSTGGFLYLYSGLNRLDLLNGANYT